MRHVRTWRAAASRSAMTRRRRAFARSAQPFSAARAASKRSTSTTRGLGEGRRREQHAALHHRPRRHAHDRVDDLAVRPDADGPVQRTVAPRPDLRLPDATRQLDRHVDPPGRRAPASADELPVQLAGVAVPLGRALGPVAQGERIVAGHRPEGGHLDDAPVLVDRVALRGRGLGQLERALGAVDAEHLDPLAALGGEVPVHVAEAAVELEGALLGDQQVAVGTDVSGDADRVDLVRLGGGRAGAAEPGREQREKDERGADGPCAPEKCDPPCPVPRVLQSS